MFKYAALLAPLTAATPIVASGSASSVESGIDNTANMLWALTDVSMGFTMGAYGPLQKAAYDGKCYSAMWNYGALWANWSRFFDFEIELHADLHTIIYFWELLHFGWATYETIDTCVS